MGFARPPCVEAAAAMTDGDTSGLKSAPTGALDVETDPCGYRNSEAAAGKRGLLGAAAAATEVGGGCELTATTDGTPLWTGTPWGGIIGGIGAIIAILDLS